MRRFLFVLNLALYIEFSYGFKFYTPLYTYKLPESMPNMEKTHLDHVFGRCEAKGLVKFLDVKWTSADLKEKILVRSQPLTEFKRFPTCIIMRAISESALTYNMPYSFQICVVRLTFIHSEARKLLHFYELYVPTGYNGDMDWHIYFYGPPKPVWL